MWKSLLGNISPSVSLSTITAALNEPDDPVNEPEETPFSPPAPTPQSTAGSRADHSDGFFTPPRLPPSPRVLQQQAASDREIIATRLGLGALRTPSRQNSGRREPVIETHQRNCVALVETAKSGGIATLLIFEHSSAGKRHTLDSVLPVITGRIFSSLPVNHTVRTTVVEICGNQCFDLLDDESPSPVRVLDRDDGSVRFVGALCKSVNTAEELLDALVTAKGRPASNKKQDGWFSRHLFCRIVIVPPSDAPAGIRQGTLTIFDSTGAYRKDVDASIWAIKECLHASKYSGGTAVPNTNNGSKGDTISTCSAPYSHSTVTRCLREGLREDATFHVIEAENPDQTIMSLRTTSSTFSEDSASPNKQQRQTLPIPPRRWDNARLCEWLTSRHLIAAGNIAAVPPEVNGRAIMKMSKPELQKTFYNNDDSKKADLLYRCLRAETDRVARLEVKRRMAANREQPQNEQ